MGVSSAVGRCAPAMENGIKDPVIKDPVFKDTGANPCRPSLCTSEMSPRAGRPKTSSGFMLLSVFCLFFTLPPTPPPHPFPVSMDPGPRMVP